MGLAWFMGCIVKNAPRLAYRRSQSLIHVAREFGTEDKVTQWCISRRWPEGIRYVWCDSDAISPRKHSSMPFHGRTCRKDFSVKTHVATLQGFVRERMKPEILVFSDEALAYDGLRRPHGRVTHSVKEFVYGMIHTNDMESHWATRICVYVGVYHHMSREHLGRYPNEFASRRNARQMDTRTQMTAVVQDSVGKRMLSSEQIGQKHTRQPVLITSCE